MGADIGDLVKGRETELEDLSGTAGIDAFNAIYGFLANIRQPDGTPLKDSKGRVTSHLSGLLYRNTNLYEAGIKPCYVFDGEPPELKTETVEERREKKSEAKEAYREAKKQGDEAEMLKHAQQATTLDTPQVESSVRLLNAMNVPWVEAPGEGEAQAAHMCLKNDLDYVGSQDYDALLFGAPVLVRNLTIRGRQGKKLMPELIKLEETLDSLDLSREELIEVAILVGTDYNDGVHGVGPKTALELIRGDGLQAALEEHEIEVDVDAVKHIYLEPEITDDYSIEWEAPDEEAVVDLLCGEYEFSEDRVRKALDRISQSVKQSSLDRWS